MIITTTVVLGIVMSTSFVGLASDVSVNAELRNAPTVPCSITENNIPAESILFSGTLRAVRAARLKLVGIYNETTVESVVRTAANCSSFPVGDVVRCVVLNRLNPAMPLLLYPETLATLEMEDAWSELPMAVIVVMLFVFYFFVISWRVIQWNAYLFFGQCPVTAYMIHRDSSDDFSLDLDDDVEVGLGGSDRRQSRESCEEESSEEESTDGSDSGSDSDSKNK